MQRLLNQQSQPLKNDKKNCKKFQKMKLVMINQKEKVGKRGTKISKKKKKKKKKKKTRKIVEQEEPKKVVKKVTKKKSIDIDLDDIVEKANKIKKTVTKSRKKYRRGA